MNNIKYNYFLSKLDDEFLLVAECFLDNIYYSVHFLIKDNKFEVKYISTTKDKKGTVEYEYRNSRAIINENNVDINLDYLFIFDDEIEIPFKLNKVFDKNDVCDSKYDQFDKLDDVFVVKYIEDLVRSKQLYRDNDFIYENAEKLFNLIRLIEKRYMTIEPFNLNCKMTLEEAIKNATDFFNDNNININIEELINDGTINFVDSNMSRNQDGTSYYDEDAKRKLVELRKREDILMLVVLIHELMHYYNQPNDNNRTFSSEYLTEVISYSCELISIDKYIDTKYKEDVQKIIKNIFYSLLSCANFMYSSILSLCIYKNNNKISKEEIEKYINFERYKQEMSNYIKERHNLSKDLWNLIGYYLAIYNYVQYKKDSNHLNKIIELNDNINEKDLLDCLKIIEINSMEEVASKGLESLDEYIEYINKRRVL